MHNSFSRVYILTDARPDAELGGSGMLFQGSDETCIRHPRTEGRPVVDGLLLEGGELWVVIAHSEQDLLGWFEPGSETPPVRMCRALLEDGTVVLGTTDPERDSLLSQMAPGSPRAER
jgi:hypothetical protein